MGRKVKERETQREGERGRKGWREVRAREREGGTDSVRKSTNSAAECKASQHYQN